MTQQNHAAQESAKAKKIASRAALALAKARNIIARELPYLAHEVYGSVYVPTQHVPTAAVTQDMVIYYNPAFIAGIPQEEVNFVLWHEVNHPLRAHHQRLLGVDPTLSNVAKDLAINTHGRHLPSSFVNRLGHTPRHYGFPEDLLPEEYLDRLRAGVKADPSLTACSGGSGSSDGDYPWEEGQGQDSGDNVGRSEAEIRSIRVSTAAAINKEVASCNGQLPGHLSADLRDWAQALLSPPKVDWRKQLQEHLFTAINRIRASSAGDQRTFSRLHRRTYRSNTGVCYPSRAESIPNVVLILDTSGSMGMNEFGPALREMRGILTALRIQAMKLVQADVEVASVEEIRVRDLLNLQLRGRGGTAFRYALEEAVKQKASLIVYFTDGYGDSPPDPGIPTIWVGVGPDARRPVPWGSYVHVAD